MKSKDRGNARRYKFIEQIYPSTNKNLDCFWEAREMKDILY